MNDFEKYDETKLHGKEDFYSLLQDEHISDKNYEYAKKFGMNVK